MKRKNLAIIGNPNSGKTTLFNRLTGLSQHVGNWPGVTVEKKTGQVSCGGQTATLADLPGVYSLSPYTQEEIIAREFLLAGEADGIINIVDGTNLARNLYLTLQLIALEMPMVVVIGFMDDCRAQGMRIDTDALGKALGVPVIAVSAKSGENISLLTGALADMPLPARQPAYRGGVGAALIQAEELLGCSAAVRTSLPFYASKLLEGDIHIAQTLDLPEKTRIQIAALREALAARGKGQDAQMQIADARYAFIEEAVTKAVKQEAREKTSLSARIDRVVLHRALAIPIFALVMCAMFAVTFGPPGSWLSSMMEHLIADMLTGQVRELLAAAHAAQWITALVCDGIFAGVGSVISFLPQILLLFFCLSLLEDSGYLARITFLMDGLLRKIGLSGKAFVPMLMGFGCTTPAVMAARTMEREEERKMTVLLTPFMSCGAKLPVYAAFASALFAGKAGLIIFSLYALGLLEAIAAGSILRKTLFRGVSAGYILELPPYRMPTWKGTMRSLWHKARDFLVKAGTVIFLMSIAVWFMQSYTFALAPAGSPAESMLGMLGRFIAPAFAPAGFFMWEAVVALLAGLVAKEAVLGTLGVLYGASSGAALAGALGAQFTPLSAYCFLVFILLYTPCVSAFAAIRRELGSTKWAFGAALAQTGAAYITAVVIYQIGRLIV